MLDWNHTIRSTYPLYLCQLFHLKNLSLRKVHPATTQSFNLLQLDWNEPNYLVGGHVDFRALNQMNEDLWQVWFQANEIRNSFEV